MQQDGVDSDSEGLLTDMLTLRIHQGQPFVAPAFPRKAAWSPQTGLQPIIACACPQPRNERRVELGKGDPRSPGRSRADEESSRAALAFEPAPGGYALDFVQHRGQ